MNLSVKCIIVDDDQYAIDILKDYIAEVPQLELAASYRNPIIALGEICNITEKCLIFLDISMPKMSGIKLAQMLGNTPHKIIFTTAHAKYAVDAFDVSAKHYLLKPIELIRFVEVVNKIIAAEFREVHVLRFDDESLFIRTGERGKLTRVLTNEIIYFQAANNYVQILTNEDAYTVYMTISEMDEILSDDPRFYRVHKSYLINKTFIQKIVGNTICLGKYDVLMSKPYKSKFITYIEGRTLHSKRI